ncbi:hypothetical protein, partial [Tropicimonas sp.]|uniref:hypothetical protein n=1 Tax=Tropicimonas sp. TaxID=2067044 RepID=UPI003A8B8786
RAAADRSSPADMSCHAISTAIANPPSRDGIDSEFQTEGNPTRVKNKAVGISRHDYAQVSGRKGCQLTMRGCDFVACRLCRMGFSASGFS